MAATPTLLCLCLCLPLSLLAADQNLTLSSLYLLLHPPPTSPQFSITLWNMFHHHRLKLTEFPSTEFAEEHYLVPQNDTKREYSHDHKLSDFQFPSTKFAEKLTAEPQKGKEHKNSHYSVTLAHFEKKCSNFTVVDESVKNTPRTFRHNAVDKVEQPKQVSAGAIDWFIFPHDVYYIYRFSGHPFVDNFEKPIVWQEKLG